MNKFVAAAIVAAAAFAAPAALPVQAATLPAHCAVLWLVPDCVAAWSPTVHTAAVKSATVAADLASPTIRFVRCEKSDSPKYLLNCTYE